jgi:two-component system, NtrC family, nitrogen regulation sensor histidine kinase GlnL
MALPGSGLIRFPWRGTQAVTPPPPPAMELLAALPIALFAVDPDGRVADTNVTAEMLLNLSRVAIIGRELKELLGQSLPQPTGDSPFAAYDYEIEITGGRKQRVDLVAAPLADRAGWRIVTVHGRARALMAGRWSEREGGTLSAVGAAAMLAHEIKNPLSGIRGAAQLLESNLDEEAKDLTTLIRNEVDRVAALIDRMEGFTDTRPLELAPQNIHAILDHARGVAQQGFGRDIAIREVYDPSLPPVLGNRDALIQVFINLMKNAAEAIVNHGGSMITLTTAYRHGVSTVRQGSDQRLSLPIEICVIDDGPGAPPEIAEYLFDPFVTTKQSGGGLGLALVDKMVADQGGIVEYAREGDPVRTVFRLLLPRGGKRA